MFQLMITLLLIGGVAYVLWKVGGERILKMMMEAFTDPVKEIKLKIAKVEHDLDSVQGDDPGSEFLRREYEATLHKLKTDLKHAERERAIRKGETV